MNALSDLLFDHQEFHSDLQMNSFITIRSGGTLYGCYKQALRELVTRRTALVQRYAQRDLLLIDLDELAMGSAGSIQARRNEVYAREKRLMMDECQRVIADTEREFIRFYEQAVSIRDMLRVRGVEFPLDAVTRNRLDCEMWEHQLKCMAAVDFMTSGRLGPQTVALLQSCPGEMRRRVARDVLPLEQHPALIDWYLTYEVPVSDQVRIQRSDVRKFIECSAL